MSKAAAVQVRRVLGPWRVRWAVVSHVVRAVFRPGVILVSYRTITGRDVAFSYAHGTGTRHGDRQLQLALDKEYRRLATGEVVDDGK